MFLYRLSHWASKFSMKATPLQRSYSDHDFVTSYCSSSKFNGGNKTWQSTLGSNVPCGIKCCLPCQIQVVQSCSKRNNPKTLSTAGRHRPSLHRPRSGNQGRNNHRAGNVVTSLGEGSLPSKRDHYPQWAVIPPREGWFPVVPQHMIIQNGAKKVTRSDRNNSIL